MIRAGLQGMGAKTLSVHISKMEKVIRALCVRRQRTNCDHTGRSVVTVRTA